MPNEASDWHGMEQTERREGGYANGAVMKFSSSSSRLAAHTIKGAKEGSFLLLLPFTVDL